MNDKISVIVPVYNVEKYFNKCVESIVNQTHTNLQIILVDDGSPDNCPQMCDEWARRDSRVKVIHKENGGLSSARNAGLDCACGDYAAFVDSDDWIDCDALERMLDCAYKNNADIVAAGFYFDNDGGTQTVQITNEKRFEKEETVLSLLIDDIRPEVCGKLYSRRVIGDFRFDESMKYAEDLPFNFNVMLGSASFFSMDTPCYHYLQNSENSITSAYITDARAESWRMFGPIFQKCKGNSRLEEACIYRFTTYTFAVLSRVMAVKAFRKKYFDLIADELILHKDAVLKNALVSSKHKAALKILSFSKFLFKSAVDFMPVFTNVMSFAKRCAAYIVFGFQTLLFTVKAVFAKIRHKDDFLFLLLTPCHENYGDQAIALAEHKLLKDKYIFEITGDMLTRFLHYPLLFKAMLGKSTLVFQGGGYLGTFWFDYGEKLLRQVMALAPNNKIIVMPQSVYYENSAYGNAQLEKSKEIYSKCSSLVLTARDKISYGLMKTYYPDIGIRLAPDVVLYLNKCKKESRQGVMLTFRNDLEKGVSYSLQSKIEEFSRRNYSKVKKVDMLAQHRISPANRESELELQFDRFRKSELVFTDRLHGMIFAAVTGTPCVVLPNKSHKIKGVYDWLFKDCEYIAFTEDLGEIKAFAESVKEKEFVYDNSAILKYYDELIKLTD